MKGLSVYSRLPPTGVTDHAGVWASPTGKLVTSRPAGSMSPSRAAATACPPCWPGSPVQRTASTSSRHGMITGPGVPFGLRLVAHHVLQAGADAAVLQPADIGRGQLAGQQR